MKIVETFLRKYPLLRVYYKGIMRRIFKLLPSGYGVKVMEEDWDNLIILDACRYDDFRDVNWIKGKLEKRISLGSHTHEWTRKNLRGEYPNTVYVSANPHISKVLFKKLLGYIPFHEIVEVWNHGWIEELDITSSRAITEAALEMRKRHPEKRLIVHYQQPHWPFPPSTGVSRSTLEPVERKLSGNGFLWKLSERLAGSFHGLRLALKKRRKGVENIWDYVREGLIDVSKVRSAYRESLRMVLEEVEHLVEILEGKIVITSDHGNLFGEHYMYGHPPGMRFKELVEVPWLEVES